MKNLFNVADEALVHLVGDEDFDASLVHHVLLQEHVLLEEGLLGDSTRLFNHIERARKTGDRSLFLEAVAEGAIVPALREVGPAPVLRLFERWRESYGVNFRILTPEYSSLRSLVRDSLQRSVDSGRRFYEWPATNRAREDIYLTILRAVLRRESPPIQEPAPLMREQGRERRVRMERLWSATARWRVDGVEAAAAKTKEAGKPGVSRTQLVNVIGESFGLNATLDGSQLPEILQRTTENDGARAFIRWMNQCFHLAGAHFFQTAVHFPVYDLSDDFVATSILGEAAADTWEHAERVVVEALLPPPAKLAQVPAVDLLRIRREYGRAYFEAIDEWSGHPADSYGADVVRHTLQDYAEQLCRVFRPETLYRVELSASRPRDLLSGDVQKGLDALGRGLADGIPLGSYVQLLRSGYQCARWWMKRQKYQPRTQTIDVTVPIGT